MKAGQKVALVTGAAHGIGRAAARQLLDEGWLVGVVDLAAADLERAFGKLTRRVCLIAGDKVVKIVERPLDKAKVRFPSSVQVVTFFFGENKLWTLQIDTKKQPFFPLSTNRFVSVQVVPVAVEAAGGSNQVLGLRVDTNSAPEMFQKLHVDIVNLSPTGAFFVAFQVAFYGGLALASPFVFYFIAQFVFPALKMKEKKYVYRGLGFGAGLFATVVLNYPFNGSIRIGTAPFFEGALKGLIHH